MKLSTAKHRFLGRMIGGRYRVRERIGRGSMGAVYRVEDTQLGRALAMKTLPEELLENEGALARLRREADAIAALNHPNIVHVIDWHLLEDGSPCLFLELLEGEDLGRFLAREGPLPWATLALIGDQILSALVAAHRTGVVHRDLKPDNVFLALDDSGEARAKLLDFGVSKVGETRTLSTNDGQIIGTPSYMSPEQARGERESIGPACDVWAMGALLFEMATGRQAFKGPNIPATLYIICHEKAPPLTSLRADAPEGFSRLLGKVLSRDPEDRITDAAILRQGLRDSLHEHLTGARLLPGPIQVATASATSPPATPSSLEEIPASHGKRLGRAPAPTRRARRGPWIVLLLTLSAVLGSAAAIALHRSERTGAPRAATPAPAAPAESTATPSPPSPPPAAPVAGRAPAPDVPEAADDEVPASERSRLRVTSTPTGAEVFRVADGVKLGRTPFETELAPGPGHLALRLKHPLHEDQMVEVPIDRDSVRHVTLRRKPRRRPAPAHERREPRALGDGTVDPFSRGSR